ncbi:MAG: hypothetical protein QOG64_85, partial [Acidimicrobiaceae bacterium]|nr:hypothetical protein [Acidimicrobiaceae bacterium]
MTEFERAARALVAAGPPGPERDRILAFLDGGG